MLGHRITGMLQHPFFVFSRRHIIFVYKKLVEIAFIMVAYLFGDFGYC